MTLTWIRPAAATVLCAVLVSGPAAAQQQATHTIAPGKATEIRVNVTGDVTLAPDDLATEITVSGSAPVGTPPLKVEVTHTGARLNLALSGPARSVLPFAPSGHTYTVRYPARLRVDLREFAGAVSIAHARAPVQIYNANGPISILGASAPVTAEADNGAIAASGIGSAIAATTGSGRVSVALASGWSGREVRLESSNGALELALPPGTRAHFDLSTGQGAIHNAFANDPKAPLIFMLTERGDINVTRENL